MISRRTFLASAALAPVMMPRLGFAQGAKMKLSHYLPPMHQMHGWLTAWASDLREKSSGEIDIEIFPASQMGPPPRQYDMVRTGVADIGLFFPTFTPGRFPLTDVHLMSFAYAKPDTLKPILASDASEIATRLFDHYAATFEGTKPLLAAVTPGGGFFMRDKMIAKPADLAGLRLRPPGPIVASYVEAWGGANAMFPPAEVGDAISKGTIDGAVFSFEAARAFQLGVAVKKVSLLPASTGIFVLTMNQGVYDGLSPASRQLIDGTTGPAAARTIGGLYADAEVAGRKYMEGAGAEIVDIELEQAKEFKSITDGVMEKALEDMEGKGIPARALNAALRKMVADA